MAIAAERVTMFRVTPGRTKAVKVAAATKIYKNSLVAVNAGGFLVECADVAAITCVGWASETVDNTTGANGDKLCEVKTGAIKCKSLGGAPIVQGTVGKVCFASDGETVRVSGGTNSIKVGVVEELDADGDAWVWIDPGSVGV